MEIWKHPILLSLRILSGRNGSSSALQTFGANSVVLVINFATGVLTARMLGPSGRGELTALIVWPQLLASFISLGLPQAVIYNIRRHTENERFFLGGAIFISGAAGIGAMLIGFLFAKDLLGQYDESIAQFVRLSMIICPMITISSVALASLQAAGRFGLSNINVLLAPVGTLILLLGLGFAGKLSPFSAAFAYLLPTGIVLAFCLVFSLRTFGMGIRSAENRLLLEYGVRVWGIDLLGTLSRQMDRAILVNLLPPSGLGAYVIAQSLSQALGVAPASIGTVLFPKTAGRSIQEVLSVVGLAIRVTLAFVGAGTFVLCLAAPLLFNWIYGDAFEFAVTPFRILACEAIFGAASSLASQVFMAVGRPGLVAVSQGLGVGLFVPLAYLLVPVMGLNGAASAWLAGSVARTVMMYLCFPIVLRVRPPSPILRSADIAEVFRRIRPR